MCIHVHTVLISHLDLTDTHSAYDKQTRNHHDNLSEYGIMYGTSMGNWRKVLSFVVRELTMMTMMSICDKGLPVSTTVHFLFRYDALESC